MDLALSTSTWQFVLPIAPEAVDVTYESVAVSWQSVTDGVFKVPAGRQPQGISFHVLLPGEFTLGQLYPDKQWLDPASFQQQNDPAGGVLHTAIATEPLQYVADLQSAIWDSDSVVLLVCPDLWTNGLYRVESIQAHHSGPHGDIDLGLSLSEYRSPSVTILNAPVTYGPPTAAAPLGTANGQPIQGPAPITAGPATASAPLGTVNGAPVQGPLPPPGTTPADGTPQLGGTYTTQDGDTLYTIAARTPGVSDPTTYALAIWAANIDTYPDLPTDGSVDAGLVLQLP